VRALTMDRKRKEEIVRNMLRVYLKKAFRDEDVLSARECEEIGGQLVFDAGARLSYSCDEPMKMHDLIKQIVDTGKEDALTDWANQHGI
jgi:hypothetical protein